MTEATTYQCPNCNGVLAFDARTGKLACSFCGSAFSEGEAERAMPSATQPQRAKLST